MSATPLTDAYLASRCKGENKQSWVEFARGLEEKLKDVSLIPGIRWALTKQYDGAVDVIHLHAKLSQIEPK